MKAKKENKNHSECGQGRGTKERAVGDKERNVVRGLTLYMGLGK